MKSKFDALYDKIISEARVTKAMKATGAKAKVDDVLKNYSVFKRPDVVVKLEGNPDLMFLQKVSYNSAETGLVSANRNMVRLSEIEDIYDVADLFEKTPAEANSYDELKSQIGAGIPVTIKIEHISKVSEFVVVPLSVSIDRYEVPNHETECRSRKTAIVRCLKRDAAGKVYTVNVHELEIVPLDTPVNSAKEAEEKQTELVKGWEKQSIIDKYNAIPESERLDEAEVCQDWGTMNGWDRETSEKFKKASAQHDYMRLTDPEKHKVTSDTPYRCFHTVKCSCGFGYSSDSSD